MGVLGIDPDQKCHLSESSEEEFKEECETDFQTKLTQAVDLLYELVKDRSLVYTARNGNPSSTQS